MPKQIDYVIKLSDKELIYHVYYTQLLLLATAFLLGIFLFDDWQTFMRLFRFDWFAIAVMGGGGAAGVLLLNWLLNVTLPKSLYDDGGINRRIFSSLPFWHIGVLTFIIAVVEEILFRGVLQTTFGLIFTSLVFAVAHIRYLHKWVLFLTVVLLSFFLGWLFLMTENLLVPITAHFFIDFILGCAIRWKKEME